MNQGLKQILSNYIVSYNATKAEFNETKKAFAEIKYASSFTQQQILQQVSTSLLAQANQAPSIALSLV